MKTGRSPKRSRGKKEVTVKKKGVNTLTGSSKEFVESLEEDQVWNHQREGITPSFKRRKRSGQFKGGLLKNLAKQKEGPAFKTPKESLRARKRHSENGYTDPSGKRKV